jgi:hypothetical protein
VVLGQAAHDGQALLVRRVVPSRVEEAVPVLRAPLDVMEAVADVGDDAVQVDDGERGARQAITSSASSTYRQRPFTRASCAGVRTRAVSRAGLATTTASALARETATLSRLRL